MPSMTNDLSWYSANKLEIALRLSGVGRVRLAGMMCEEVEVDGRGWITGAGNMPEASRG